MPSLPTTRSSESGSVPFAETNASVLLDLFRGLAALLVLIGHWRYLAFVDYPKLQLHRKWLALPYLLTSVGHQAVVIFFVLSGYLIGGSVMRSMNARRWSWRTYMTHRLVRLWVVVLPGLLLCVLWDKLGLYLHRAPVTYGGLGPSLANVAACITWPIFFANLFFLQMVRYPTLGSDGALWSLAPEFWYYVLFPLGLTVIHRHSKISARLLCAALYVLVYWLVGRVLFVGFVLWLAGVLLALIKPPKVSATVRWLAAALYTPFFFLIAKYPFQDSATEDYVLAAVTVVFFWIALSARSKADPHAKAVRFSRATSRFSFTLYIAHTPFLLLLLSIVAGDARWAPTPAHIAMATLLLLATLAYSYGMASLTEFHTDAIRRWIEQRLGIVKRPRITPQDARFAE